MIPHKTKLGVVTLVKLMDFKRTKCGVVTLAKLRDFEEVSWREWLSQVL